MWGSYRVCVRIGTSDGLGILPQHRKIKRNMKNEMEAGSIGIRLINP